MEELKHLKPKIKLRELKAIQKDYINNIQKRPPPPRKQSSSLEEGEIESSRSECEEESSIEEQPAVIDRETKKIMQLEQLFRKRELEMKKKQDREQRKLNKKNTAELVPSSEAATAETPPVVVTEGAQEEVKEEAPKPVKPRRVIGKRKTKGKR